MSFSDNLQHMRTHRGMTQEQLAMLLGVSRQSISKWESEKAYPEMDKLLVICDLFGCTLDDLVLGDVRRPGQIPADNATLGVAASGQTTSQSNQIAANTAISGSSPESPMPSRFTPDSAATGTAVPKDVVGYDEHMLTFARRTALGVASIIAGAGIGMLFARQQSLASSVTRHFNSFMLLLFILVGVVVGLSIIIPAGMAYAEFHRKHPYVEDFYTDADRSRESRFLAISVVVGIAVILIGVLVLVFARSVLDVQGSWPISLLLLCVATGVASFIYSGIRYARLDVAAYNKEAEAQSDSGDGSTGKDYWERLRGSISGIIMLLATVVGLVMLFVGHHYESWAAQYFWLSWVIGGILCGIASLVIDMMRNHRDHED